MQKNISPTAKKRSTRSGVVVLELILTMPVFLIIMLATIQISLIYVVIEQTAYASRYAAKIASETLAADINTLNTGDQLKGIIDDVLETGGLPAGSCRVVLEHNVIAPNTIIDPPAGCACAPPVAALPSVAGASADESVRTTICVELNGNVPDFLDTFGFSIAGYIVKESTTYIYELQ